MKQGIKKGLAVLALAVAALWSAGGTAQAQQDSALIDALVKKGVLSQDEAKDIEASLQKDYNQSSAGKLQLGSFISKLQLFGDARLRYEYANAKANTGGTNQNNDRDRFRYRLRLGALYTYDAHWSAGVRLETATTENSANADFGRYFDKYGDGVNVGQLWLEYQDKFSLFDSTSTVADGKNYKTVTDPGVTVGVDFRLGKAAPQILLSSAWFYDEINPEGLAEEVTFSNVGIDGLSFAARGAEYLTSVPNQTSLTNTPGSVGGVVGGPLQPGENDIGALFIAQVEAKYAWDSSSNVRIAPLFLTETKAFLGDQEASGNNALGVTPATSTANIDSTHPYAYLGRLAVVAVPGEVNWKLWNLPNKVWGTYGVNLEGNDRYHALGFTGSGHNTFWNIGYQIGQNKKKGDWTASAEWRWIETASYTTNLSDTNWAANDLNQQGFVLRTGYNFTDFLLGQVSYYHSNPIDVAHNTPGAGAATYASTASSAPFGGQIDVLQVDLSWKF